VRIWDADTGEPVTTLQGHTGGVRSVAYRPGGRQLATASWDGTVRVWDAETGTNLLVAATMARATASWIPGSPPQLVSASAEAWRWLRLRVLDESGRFISQDPYEWHYPSATPVETDAIAIPRSSGHIRDGSESRRVGLEVN
jgi:WD40 repeat protein